MVSVIMARGGWGWRQRLVDPRTWAFASIVVIAELGMIALGLLPVWYSLCVVAVFVLIDLAVLPPWRDEQRSTMFGAGIMVIFGVPFVGLLLGSIWLISRYS